MRNLLKLTDSSLYRFIINSVVVNVILLLLFFIFVSVFYWKAWVSSTFVYVLGLVILFFVHGKHSFKVAQLDIRSFIYFIIVYGVGYCIQIASLSLFISIISMKTLSQFLAMGCVAIYNYILMRHFVFKKGSIL